MFYCVKQTGLYLDLRGCLIHPTKHEGSLPQQKTFISQKNYFNFYFNFSCVITGTITGPAGFVAPDFALGCQNSQLGLRPIHWAFTPLGLSGATKPSSPVIVP